MIDVDGGGEDSLGDLKSSVEKSGIRFPVLWDRNARTIGKYGIRAFPAADLSGDDGTVVREGIPLPSIRQGNRTADRNGTREDYKITCLCR